MKYTAITIGPTLKTLQLARKTRELWGASYLLSYICKELIQQIRIKDNKCSFIVPYVPKDEITDFYKPQIGAGLFPDRIIFEDNLPEGSLEEIKTELLTTLAERITNKIKEDEDKVAKYLNQYFRIEHITKEYNDILPVISIQNYLDTAELQCKLVENDSQNYISTFLNKITNSFLTEEAFSREVIKDGDIRGKCFPSIPELASAQFRTINSDVWEIAQKDLYEKLNQKKEETRENLFYDIFKGHDNTKNDFRTYHKYVAIVQADGDSVGELIRSFENGEVEKSKIEIADLSKNLFEFAKQSVEKISKYGGECIYAGGDDLLFMAPVVGSQKENNNYQNIFDLINTLSTDFQQRLPEQNIIKEGTSINVKPTLSFGVSISYYKFPLQEALSEATSQLFEKAKKTEGKNAVALRVLKHSGQYFDTIFKKNTEAYNIFCYLMSIYTQQNDDNNFLMSVIKKIYDNTDRIIAIYENENKDSEKFRQRLQFTFNSEFNNDIHTIYEDLTTGIINLTVSAFKIQTPANAMKMVYAALRFIKFLIRKDTDE
ncbi:type III-B CRISPR-associated protein Cas10/Cmr2 [Marinifilum sp. D737]|uniref:type III-B CRISPR-associated protein Cas10/Cmr2 n=1 Tax=Marinifilum sp. D737 TaxID=2969628 RepID=UPI0022742439|nr:type III-B CRISPR-associated protein Cas10/Cmr2 [Marinifilum sp. D737]MCY1634986.1 type III-B CRISPR-associated protein Cas10/Cmr2 [Marinifilum sp. D737]